MHTSRSTLGWPSTEHLSSISQDVNQVSIECCDQSLIGFLLFVDQDVHWHLPTMPLVHKVMIFMHRLRLKSCVKYMYLVLFMTANHVWETTRETVLLLLYYYYYAWLHYKYLCMLLYEKLICTCPKSNLALQKELLDIRAQHFLMYYLRACKRQSHFLLLKI